MTKPFSADWMDERGTERGRWLTSESLLSPEEMGRLTTCPRCRLLTPHVRGRAQPHSVYGTYCNARAR